MPDPLTWNNQGSINTITRTAAATVTWTAADPNGSIIISGYSLGPERASTAQSLGWSIHGAADRAYRLQQPGSTWA